MPSKVGNVREPGKRPSEKLFEEILTTEEGADSSCHEKIFIARNGRQYTMNEITPILAEFSAVIRNPSPDSIAADFKSPQSATLKSSCSER